MIVEPVRSPRATGSPESQGLSEHDRTAPGHPDFEGFLREVDPEPGDRPMSLRAWMDLAEAWKITRALRECRGNRSAAARSLGIGRRTLYAKMEKLRITPTWRLDTSER